MIPAFPLGSCLAVLLFAFWIAAVFATAAIWAWHAAGAVVIVSFVLGVGAVLGELVRRFLG